MKVLFSSVSLLDFMFGSIISVQVTADKAFIEEDRELKETKKN